MGVADFRIIGFSDIRIFKRTYIVSLQFSTFHFQFSTPNYPPEFFRVTDIVFGDSLGKGIVVELVGGFADANATFLIQ